MAADGVKKEEELIINHDPKPILLLDDHHQNMNIINNHAENINNNNNNKKKGISIAERRAAKCGFNASNISTARPAAYFTIPSGISPSALLDSPVMLPNAQAQLSPTTGTFQFPSPNHESLKLKLKLASNGDNSVAMDAQGNNMRVENKSLEELEYPRDFQVMTNKNSCFGGTTTHVNTDQVLGNKSREADITTNLQPNTTRNQQILSNNNNNNTVDHTNVNKERNTNNNQKGSYFTKEVAKYSEDGFYWRKYGQKHVKGSEYPRSYYRCTNANCPVKKKVERSHDGQITEIVYKGSHNHPEPQPVKRFGDVLDRMSCDQGTSSCFKTEGGAIPSAGNSKLDGDWRGGDHSLDNGLACSTSFMSTDHLSDPASRTMNAFEPVDPTAQEISSTFGSQDCDDNNVQNEASPESTSFNDEDDENGENEPKKRKRESFPSETSMPRSAREPRVVVQIESDIDILEDGYRWRKYGQKVVKGNPNPRSYYKCTTPGCPVRKHVERAANDIKSVITTYEGKHNHDVPSSKTGSLVISDVANLPPAVTNSTLNSSQLGQKTDHHHHHHHHHVSKTGKQVQDHNLPLYLERKPMLNYNELMRSSNLPGNFSSDLSFGTSSVYPLSFPPFHSLPYGSLLMNGNNNHMKSTSYNHNQSSSLYPMLPDYMSLQSQINPAGSANVGNFHQFNNYGGGAAAAAAIQGQEKNIVKPKEEQRDESELYDTCLSIPNHGNGTI